jgi:hypothetical protein
LVMLSIEFLFDLLRFSFPLVFYLRISKSFLNFSSNYLIDFFALSIYLDHL